MTVGRSTSPTHQKGAMAEDIALIFLQQRGFELITQNFNTAYGELDLVVRQSSLLVFVEVRQRKAKALVSALESITAAKQRKIIRSAMVFLQQHPQFEHDECRFDVIAMTTSELLHQVNSFADAQIEWIEAAFNA